MPNLHVIDSKQEESINISVDMRKRIESVRVRASGDNLLEYWDHLKCQQDRGFLLECIDNILSIHSEP
jgi:hypothetical protein